MLCPTKDETSASSTELFKSFRVLERFDMSYCNLKFEWMLLNDVAQLKLTDETSQNFLLDRPDEPHPDRNT
ncbi:uncharacterized protein PHALS_07111 [Plasmopara halstedii]|uniref:Uncharacterized protein n=1 Tax=Plasmopara halstedii TaxID=4781 RepID=A0A0P1B6G0_PLAHL|nr:uncharacterized protein PHALS_07111 [Plasmopara halstedii]CEG49343.1 hypothetical protein PHALS_07111 [Plasmopara halstedii]|eukprot:XP_024585712.1 hypothetical protein PHALS_07111 [Plasmopara halstedii]